MRGTRWVLLALGTVIWSLGLAAGSVAVHRPERMVVGNVCDATPVNPDGLCYDLLPRGGWPFSFLADSPSTSVRGVLGPEDTFDPTGFLLDAVIVGVVSLGAVTAVRRIRRRAPASQPAATA